MRIAAALLCTLAVTAVGCGGGASPDDRTAPPEATERRAPDGSPGREGRPLARSEGEARVETVAENLDTPWEIAFLPDGRSLITERGGTVRLLSSDLELRSEPVARVDRVAEVGEAGLLGLAIDPDFEENRLVYMYRTTQEGNEVVRFRFAGGRLDQERVIASGIAAAVIHDGGRLRFGPDERLYFSTGDAGVMASAQDPRSLNGKILRLDPRAYRGRGGRPEVYSLGHRNPQGFDWQPRTGRFVEDEHGPDGDDEVNLLRRGANYGWPELRGGQERRGFTAPAAFYPGTIAPSGATFVRLPGSEWSGDYLIGCLAGEQIRRLSFDGGRVTTNEALFDGDFGRIRTVVEGPDGALYALTNNTDGRGFPREGDDRLLRIVPPAS